MKLLILIFIALFVNCQSLSFKSASVDASRRVLSRIFEDFQSSLALQDSAVLEDPKPAENDILNGEEILQLRVNLELNLRQ